MTLVLDRNDIEEQYLDVDFNDLSFEHFKIYAQRAIEHCAVGVFRENEYRKKEIEPGQRRSMTE